MPHFGLMDEEALGPEQAALMRSRLHLRSARRRLHQKKVSLGLATLFDALVSAMQWYAVSPERRAGLRIEEGEDLSDESALYAVLARSGIIDGVFDFDAFGALVDKGLTVEMSPDDSKEILPGVESVMTQLGVMPFDEDELPHEAPSAP
jgi:hypothetical protein